MKNVSTLLQNETLAAALAGAAGFAMWALFAAVLATRHLPPIWS